MFNKKQQQLDGGAAPATGAASSALLSAAPGVSDSSGGMMAGSRTRNWLQAGDADLWIDDESGQMSTINPNRRATGTIAERWGEDAAVSEDGLNVYLPDQNINVPINADGSQDMIRSIDNRHTFNNFMMDYLPVAGMALMGGVAAGAAAAGAGASTAAGTSAAVAEGAAVGSTAAGTTAAGTAASTAGSLMPAAVAETSAALTAQGLSQTAAGVWAGAGATGYGTGAAAGALLEGGAELGTISTSGSGTGATSAANVGATSAEVTSASSSLVPTTARQAFSLAGDAMTGMSALSLLAGGAAEPEMPSVDDVAPLPQRGEIEPPRNETRQMETRGQRLDAQARAAGAQRSGNMMDTRGKRPKAPKTRGAARQELYGAR
jgi:hypothetical protein